MCCTSITITVSFVLFPFASNFFEEECTGIFQHSKKHFKHNCEAFKWGPPKVELCRCDGVKRKVLGSKGVREKVGYRDTLGSNMIFRWGSDITHPHSLISSHKSVRPSHLQQGPHRHVTVSFSWKNALITKCSPCHSEFDLNWILCSVE